MRLVLFLIVICSSQSFAHEQLQRIGFLSCQTEDMLHIPMTFEEFQENSSFEFGLSTSTVPGYGAPFILKQYYSVLQIPTLLADAKELSCELKFGLNRSILNNNGPTDISCDYIKLPSRERLRIYSTTSEDYNDCEVLNMM